MLKLVSKKSNLYARKINANAFLIKKDKDTNNNYKIQQLLNRHITLQKRDIRKKKFNILLSKKIKILLTIYNIIKQI